MRRVGREPRPDATQKIEQLGLLFHTVNEKPYWYEGAAYEFDAGEIEVLERATNELHSLCLDAVERVIAAEDYDRFEIPKAARCHLAEAWEQDPPSLYGRFDLAFDGTGPPKLLEYNADTPTSLLEAAVIQWHWLQEVLPDCDQFNSIWEGLVEKWTALRLEGLLHDRFVHFACMDEPEDLMTTAVLMDTAREAGLDVKLMGMASIGWDSIAQEFVDQEGRPIQTIFKLYPWEWMLREEFAPHALATYRRTQWIEPLWKALLSNKAILAVLWELFPSHPNLLPSYLGEPYELREYVRKPILGREGANVSIRTETHCLDLDGPYDNHGFVFQEYAPLPCFEGNHAVIGSWVIDGEARGIGIRESDGPITEDLARFVPHYFRPKPIKID